MIIMINVFYRLCEKESGTHCEGRPEWFSKKKCLTSFLNAVENAKEHIGQLFFVHDGPKGDLYEMIRGFYGKDYYILNINEGNYLGSLNQTYDLALRNCNNDLYFVEDDYLHLPDSISKIALSINDLEFLSPYDHLACYDPVKYIGQPRQTEDRRTQQVADHTWKVNEFSCHTYAIRSDVFIKNKDVITSDSCARADISFYRTMYSYGYPLWVPEPALTTQVDTYMSPNFDWEEFNKTL